MRSGRGHGWGGNVDEVTAMTGVVTEGVKLAGPHGTMKITTSDGKVWNITLAPPSRHAVLGVAGRSELNPGSATTRSQVGTNVPYSTFHI